MVKESAPDGVPRTGAAAMTYLRQVFSEFFRDRCTTMAAALSYYTVFALPPLLYLLMAVVTAGLSVAYDSETAEDKAEDILKEQATQLLGEQAASEEIGAMIERGWTAPGVRWKAALSVAGFVFAITGLMGVLQSSLNVVWSVRPDPDRSKVKYLLRKRFVSFGLVIGLGFLLLASMVASGAIAYLGDRMKTLTDIDPLPASWINYGVQVVVAFVVFAVVFKVLPDVRVAWSDVVVGALITTVLFLAGRIAIQQYFTVLPLTARLGGAAASLAAVYVWVYYSAMILLLGAEATEVYAHRSGRRVRPSRRAVRVVETIERDPA